ncbi:tocopherol cyclase family protein [Neolewinella antarctica]|uniref:Tocopherol cyclase n=1 Tax=Neolewinella antarctica TaxID=442734 RepID=A0ABX0XF55_9BACT|nr:tocopherol cyclase family protein [Neolewinella antarctica]NJC27852.1 hypothetical protein [Neolewinella antarctica]
MLQQKLARVFDAPRFQGWGREKSYFEGWYFKVVVPERNLAYAFIPGISYDADGVGHAFLQVLDGVAATSTYHEYDVAEFQPARDRFFLRLGPHEFSEDQLKIDLPGLQLDLTLLHPIPWASSVRAPGIMGWYGYVPRMQCYHGLVSFHHELAGTITVNDQKHDAAGGVGYTEKDWGSGFPDAWVWCQSNHLSGTDSPASLMASVASIPWLGSSFTGFLATFYFEGELHLFTTWARSRVQCHFHEEQGTVTLTFTKPGKKLVVTGTPAEGGTLASPVTAAGMTGKINESLRAELGVELWLDGALAYRGTASWAGLEVSAGARGLLA